MDGDLYHVIMAGGSGTRFWPASRKDRPKQFLPLVGAGSMIRQTFERCAGSGPPERIFVSAGLEHREAVLASLPDLPPARFIGEPVARNTAPAVGLSALLLQILDPGSVAVFCPADHLYARPAAYLRAIETARAAASGNHLITLGISPTRPEPGYGYIEAGAETGLPGVRRAVHFIEKPAAERARALASSGLHYWNSGVFIWRTASILTAIRRHHPGLAEGLDRIREAILAGGVPAPGSDLLASPGVARLVGEVFAAQPSISVDYAVMERADNVLVVPCDPGWSDVGSWDAIAEVAGAGAEGNAVEGEVVCVGARTSLVRGGERLIALVGVEDLIIVDAADALLVCRRGQSQKVREVVEELARRGREDLL